MKARDRVYHDVVEGMNIDLINRIFMIYIYIMHASDDDGVLVNTHKILYPLQPNTSNQPKSTIENFATCAHTHGPRVHHK